MIDEQNSSDANKDEQLIKIELADVKPQPSNHSSAYGSAYGVYASIISIGLIILVLFGITYCVRQVSRMGTFEWFLENSKFAVEEAVRCSPVGGYTSAYELLRRERCGAAREAVRNIFGEEAGHSVSYFLNSYGEISDELRRGCRETARRDSAATRGEVAKCESARKASDIPESVSQLPARSIFV